MPSPAVALAGGSLVSGVLGARSASRAASAQAQAADSANRTQRYMFDRSVQLTEPQRRAGNNALAVLQAESGIGGPVVFGDAGRRNTIVEADGRFNVQNDLGDVWQSFDSYGAARDFMEQNATRFEATPGFRYGLDQAQEAINRQAAARGMRYGGATLNALATDAQGRQNQEYGNYINRLQSLAGGGQTATQQQIGAGQNFANAFGQNALAAGQARASGYMGQNNAFQGMMGNFANIYGMASSGMFGGGSNMFANNPLSVGGLR